MLQLYKNIKSRRKELKMTQSELAQKMGYADKSMIAKIEKGDVDLNQSKIMAFAKALDTTTKDLMGWEDIDQHFIGKEASDEIYKKFENNIKQHRFAKCKTENESNLVLNYRSLSQNGQLKATKYVTNLVNVENAERELNDTLTLNAASKDATATDEERRNSDNIMYDDREWE